MVAGVEELRATAKASTAVLQVDAVTRVGAVALPVAVAVLGGVAAAAG